MRLHRFHSGSAMSALIVLVGFVLTVAAPAAQAPQPQAPRPQQPQPQVPAPKTDAARPQAAAALPSARSILDKHLKAVGGRAAVLAHSSSRATGTFTVASAGITGNLEVVAAKPDRNLVRINLPGVGEIVEGYDGKNGWTVSPMTGPMLLDGKQLEDKKFDADFYGELHDDSRYQSMSTVERTEFDGRQCYKLRLVRKNGSEEFEFYDVESGLKAGRIATRETPMGTVTATVVETDYKKFGDLLLPSTIKNTIMGVQQIITIASVEYDNVQPSAFDPPAEIKALIK